MVLSLAFVNRSPAGLLSIRLDARFLGGCLDGMDELRSDWLTSGQVDRLTGWLFDRSLLLLTNVLLVRVES